MKKILFPALLFFVLACEDDESQNPLSGNWTSTSFNIDYYLKVNVTQDIFMGDYEGGIIASRYLNNNKEREIYLDIFSASTDVDITYVRITNQPLFTDSSPSGDNVTYDITDYTSNALNSFDTSFLRLSNYDTGYNAQFVGNSHLNYQLSLDKTEVRIDKDTVFYEIYTNQGNVIDSTSYFILDGVLKKKNATISANENFSVNSLLGDMGYRDLPQSVQLTLNEDGSGQEIVVNDNYTIANDFAWTSTDSTLSLLYDDVDGDGYGRQDFEYSINGSNLTLKQIEPFCDYSYSRSECESQINYMFDFGLQTGTFEDMWFELEGQFTSDNVASRKINRKQLEKSIFYDEKIMKAMKGWHAKIFGNKSHD